jgi:hypothetical protein
MKGFNDSYIQKLLCVYGPGIACERRRQMRKRGIIVGDLNDLLGGSVDKKTKQKGF